MNLSSNALPRVTNVTFRLTEAGDLFALEFACRDGETRAVALGTSALGKLMTALAATATEAGRRSQSGAPQREDLIEQAPEARLAGLAPEGRGHVALTLDFGGADFRARLTRKDALELAERVVAALAE